LIETGTTEQHPETHDVAAALDVAIVSYRCPDLLDRCLEALMRSKPGVPVRVIVVDNESDESSLGTALRWAPAVGFIQSECNLGFAAAANLAIRRGTSPYVLVLNPDTHLRPGVLDRLLVVMRERPKVGICGCRLELPDGSVDHAARRSFPTPLSALGYFTGIDRLLPSRSRLTPYREQSEESGTAGAVNGAFMLIRRTALEQVGLFDEGYWISVEDLDLCYRFDQSGWLVWYEATASATHLKSATIGRYRTPRLNVAFHRGMARFYGIHYAPHRSPLLNGTVYTGIALKCLLSIARCALFRRVLPP